MLYLLGKGIEIKDWPGTQRDQNLADAMRTMVVPFLGGKEC